jgi:aminopeptidase-like protein
MINDCTSLVSLNMDNWDLRQLNFMTSITALTPNLETISARNWKLPYNANNWTNNWNFCSSWNPNTLRSIDVTNWEFSG